MLSKFGQATQSFNRLQRALLSACLERVLLRATHRLQLCRTRRKPAVCIRESKRARNQESKKSRDDQLRVAVKSPTIRHACTTQPSQTDMDWVGGKLLPAPRTSMYSLAPSLTRMPWKQPYIALHCIAHSLLSTWSFRLIYLQY